MLTLSCQFFSTLLYLNGYHESQILALNPPLQASVQLYPVHRSLLRTTIFSWILSAHLLSTHCPLLLRAGGWLHPQQRLPSVPGLSSFNPFLHSTTHGGLRWWHLRMAYQKLHWITSPRDQRAFFLIMCRHHSASTCLVPKEFFYHFFTLCWSVHLHKYSSLRKRFLLALEAEVRHLMKPIKSGSHQQGIFFYFLFPQRYKQKITMKQLTQSEFCKTEG